MRHAREYYFACDLGTRGRRKMRQMTLSSFFMTTDDKKTRTQDNRVPVPDIDIDTLRGNRRGSVTDDKTQ